MRSLPAFRKINDFDFESSNKQSIIQRTLNQFSQENKSTARRWLTYLLVSLSVEISGITEGRPWAHWKGRSHRERDWRRFPHSSLVRASPNLMAPVVRSEIQQLNTHYRIYTHGDFLASIHSNWMHLHYSTKVISTYFYIKITISQNIPDYFKLKLQVLRIYRN